jgi:hypothetical protein
MVSSAAAALFHMRWNLVLAAGLVVLTGCATRYYDVTLANGTRVVARSKPRLIEGYYVFKDLGGQRQEISSFKVNEIAPHSTKPPSPFNNYGGK